MILLAQSYGTIRLGMAFNPHVSLVYLVEARYVHRDEMKAPARLNTQVDKLRYLCCRLSQPVLVPFLLVF